MTGSISWLRRILFATDFSREVARAQDFAVLLARQSGATIHLLYVSQRGSDPVTNARIEPSLPEPVSNEVIRSLDELTEQLRENGLQAASMNVVGNPGEQIIQAAEELGAQLIVVGSHGRTGLEHVLFGSTAEQVVKGASCPVLTARSPRSPGTATRISIERILIPIDLSDCSLDALHYGIQVARHFTASITLVHMLEWAWIGQELTISELTEGERHGFATSKRTREVIEACLIRNAELGREQGLAVDTVLGVGGDPTDFVVETASQQNVDLIIMGTHGRRGVRRALLGSVAEGILRKAPCPVITLKRQAPT